MATFCAINKNTWVWGVHFMCVCHIRLHRRAQYQPTRVQSLSQHPLQLLYPAAKALTGQPVKIQRHAEILTGLLADCRTGPTQCSAVSGAVCAVLVFALWLFLDTWDPPAVTQIRQSEMRRGGAILLIKGELPRFTGIQLLADWVEARQGKASIRISAMALI